MHEPGGAIGIRLAAGTMSVARRPAARWAALERPPRLLLGFVALIVGTGAGLARLGLPVPSGMAQAAGWHGPLMPCGLFGVVISLERAVAVGRLWAYAAPLLAGLGTALALHGGSAWARWFYMATSAVLLLATLSVLQRQRDGFVLVLAMAAATRLRTHCC